MTGLLVIKKFFFLVQEILIKSFQQGKKKFVLLILYFLSCNCGLPGTSTKFDSCFLFIEDINV